MRRRCEPCKETEFNLSSGRGQRATLRSKVTGPDGVRRKGAI